MLPLTERLDQEAAPHWPTFLDDKTNLAARAALINVYRPAVASRGRRRGYRLHGHLDAEDLAHEALVRLIELLDQAKEPLRARALLASLGRDAIDYLRVHGPVSRQGQVRTGVSLDLMLGGEEELGRAGGYSRNCTIADILDSRAVYRGEQPDRQSLREFRRWVLLEMSQGAGRPVALYAALRWFRGLSRLAMARLGISNHRQHQLDRAARAWIRQNLHLDPVTYLTKGRVAA